MSRLTSRLFGGEKQELLSELAELFDHEPESLRDLLGLGQRKGAKGETPKVLAFSTLVNKRLGAALLDGLMLQARVDTMKSESVATAKLQDEQFEQHNAEEHRLRSRNNEIQGELDRARERQGALDRRNGQLRTLLAEIVAAVAEGKPLTADIISSGITLATLRFSPRAPYLVFPASPPAKSQSAESAETAAPAPEPASATAGKSTTGAG